MIQNKQVNIWRGNEEPPTIYHIWIKDESKLLLYNGTTWITFIDSTATIESINNILDRLSTLEANTINGKKLSTNPVLTSDDINNTKDGTYIKSVDTLSNSIYKIDQLITTQIVE